MTLFLGQASNYSKKAVWRHLFAFGTPKDADKLRAYLAKRYATVPERVLLTKNGRSAIALALKALVPKGSVVIINGFTCYAVVEAVHAADCIPVYTDIDPETLHYSAKNLRDTLEKYPNAKAIIIQNTLGLPCEIKQIETLAREQGLSIIEDMAHAAGIFYPDGREIGTIGDAAAFSFGKGKSLDAITGGALVMRSPDVKMPATPSRKPTFADNFRARFYPLFGSVGRASFKVHLNKLWYGGLIRLHLIRRAVDEKLDLNIRPAYWQDKLVLRQFRALNKKGATPIRQHFFVKDRPSTLKKLESAGFNFGETWYDVPVSPIRYYKKVHFPEQDCPNATVVAAAIVNIPTYYPKSTLAPAIQIIKDDQLSLADLKQLIKERAR